MYIADRTGNGDDKQVKKILLYQLHTEDLERTAGGLVNLVLKNCIRVTGHEISAAKFTADGITCEGKPVRVSDRIAPGQTLRVILPEKEDARKIIPTEGPLCVLYEDEDLLAVNKAAGEVVHPCPGHYADTAANYAAWYLENHGSDGSGSLRIAGRLDKETSGVLVFAKNRAAAARLQKQHQAGRFVRIYLAVCEGLFPPAERTGTIDRPLEKVPGDLMKMRVAVQSVPAEETGTGKSRILRAVTHYQVLAEHAGCSLLRITIDTGRTHQIRVHMASCGHPLVGDTLYGSTAPTSDHTRSMPIARICGDELCEKAQRALLHAACVRLEQPFTGETLQICAPMPEDFPVCADCLNPGEV